MTPTCGARQIILIDGTCGGDCGEYLTPDSNQQNCVSPTCGARQIILIDGTCGGDCGDYLTPD